MTQRRDIRQQDDFRDHVWRCPVCWVAQDSMPEGLCPQGLQLWKDAFWNQPAGDTLKMMDQKTPIVLMLKPEIAAMKKRLATSELLKEAEAMGFEIEIKLPEDSTVRCSE